MALITLGFSMGLALVFGFTVHRANVCMVRAVAEVLSTRQVYMMVMMLKIVLWVMLFSTTFMMLLPQLISPVQLRPVTLAAVTGGFLFGAGAAINGGCSFSTLWQLANGNIWMLVTLIGFGTGIAGMSYLLPITDPYSVSDPLIMSAAPPKVLSALLFLSWMALCWEMARLWRSRPAGRRWRELLFSKHYRLSTASIILGFSGGILYTLHDSWSYTYALKHAIQSLLSSRVLSMGTALLLFLSLFAGMLLSARQRGPIHLQIKNHGYRVRYFLGGLLMGIGTVLIPGGNDRLLMRDLPSLSFHAVPVVIMSIAGAGCMLLLIQYISGRKIRVDCSNDICRAGE